MSLLIAPTPFPLTDPSPLTARPARPARPAVRASGYRPRSVAIRAWDRPDPRPMDPHPTVLASGLVLEVVITGHAATVVVTGELCRGACHELERLAERLFLAGATSLTIDLADVTLVDAGGIRQLRRVIDLAEQCDAPARIIRPSAPVERALGVGGLLAQVASA